MLKWQQIFGGELERPGPDGKHRRQTITDVLRPLGGKIREALAIENGRLMYRTNVYMTLSCVGLVGAFLLFTKPGAAIQSLTGFKPIQLSMPSVASLFLPSEGAARDSAELATATSQQLNLLYAAGLTGSYETELKYFTAVVEKADPKDFVATDMLISKTVDYMAQKGIEGFGETICGTWASGGFYQPTFVTKHSPYVYARALSPADAKLAMAAVRTAWNNGLFDETQLKSGAVSTIRELFSHHTSGSCEPLPMAVYKLDGKSTKYLISILIADKHAVGAALYMAYDLNSLGVKDRGLKRLKYRDLTNPSEIDGVEEVMSLQAQGTYGEIAKEMKREGITIDASKNPDLAAQSAAIQPK